MAYIPEGAVRVGRKDSLRSQLNVGPGVDVSQPPPTSPMTQRLAGMIPDALGLLGGIGGAALLRSPQGVLGGRAVGVGLGRAGLGLAGAALGGASGSVGERALLDQPASAEAALREAGNQAFAQAPAATLGMVGPMVAGRAAGFRRGAAKKARMKVAERNAFDRAQAAIAARAAEYQARGWNLFGRRTQRVLDRSPHKITVGELADHIERGLGPAANPQKRGELVGKIRDAISAALEKESLGLTKNRPTVLPVGQANRVKKALSEFTDADFDKLSRGKQIDRDMPFRLQKALRQIIEEKEPRVGVLNRRAGQFKRAEKDILAEKNVRLAPAARGVREARKEAQGVQEATSMLRDPMAVGFNPGYRGGGLGYLGRVNVPPNYVVADALARALGQPGLVQPAGTGMAGRAAPFIQGAALGLPRIPAFFDPNEE